jgi:hypothetical protein
MVDQENIKADDKGPLGKADPPSASHPKRGLLSSANGGYHANISTSGHYSM